MAQIIFDKIDEFTKAATSISSASQHKANDMSMLNKKIAYINDGMGLSTILKSHFIHYSRDLNDILQIWHELFFSPDYRSFNPNDLSIVGANIFEDVYYSHGVTSINKIANLLKKKFLR